MRPFVLRVCASRKWFLPVDPTASTSFSAFQTSVARRLNFRCHTANRRADKRAVPSFLCPFTTESVSAFHVPAFQRNHSKKAVTFFSGTLWVQLVLSPSSLTFVTPSLRSLNVAHASLNNHSVALRSMPFHCVPLNHHSTTFRSIRSLRSLLPLLRFATSMTCGHPEGPSCSRHIYNHIRL